MKRAGYIILIALLIIIGLPLILLNTPLVQRKIISEVTSTISERSGFDISIQNSDINLFRGILFEGVLLSNTNGVLVMSSDKIEVGIRVLPVLRKKIDIKSLKLINADIILSKESKNSDLNIKKLIDSFKSDKRGEKDWHIDFRKVIIRNCRLKYDVLDSPEKVNGFDSNHINLNPFSAILKFRISPDNNYRFEVVKLDLKEKCGLNINNLKLKGEISDNSIKISDFLILSGKSNLKISSLDASFSSFKSIKNADSIRLSPTQIKAFIIPSDFSCISSAITDFYKPVELSMSFSGKLNDFTSSLRLNMENALLLDGRLSIKNISDFSEMLINGQVDMLRVNPEGLSYIFNLINRGNTKIPDLSKFGTLNYIGKISTIGKSLLFKGGFATHAGNIETNIELVRNNSIAYKGTLQSKSLNIDKFITNKQLFGDVSFNVSVEGSQVNGKFSEGNVNGLINSIRIAGYTYKDLNVNGTFSKNGFEGKAELNDPNGKLDFSGLVDLKKENPVYNFKLLAENVNLKALNLIKGNEISLLSFNLTADLTGKFPDNITGNIKSNDISFYNNGFDLKINDLDVDIFDVNSDRVIKIKSDFFEGESYGQFNLNDFSKDIKNLTSKYLPSLLKTPFIDGYTSGNNFDYHFTLKPVKELMKVFGLPFNTYSTVKIDGFYNGIYDKFRVRIIVPELVYGKTDLKDINILFENPQTELKLLAQAMIGKKGNYVNIDTDIRSMNDQASIRFLWSNTGKDTHTGLINSNLRFSRDKSGKQNLDARILPSELIINDTIWKLEPTEVTYKEKRLEISKFRLLHKDEFIKIDGVASEFDKDTLKISLNSFKLDEIFNILPTSNFFMGGKITGDAICPHLFKNGTMNANLFVQDFSLNKSVIGNLRASSYWNKSQKAIVLNGQINDNNNIKVASAIGAYYPIGDSINLSIDGSKVPLSFLSIYMENILGKIEGYASGKARITGPFNKIGIYADLLAKDASFGVDLLNTRYTFTDSLFLTPRYFRFKNIKVSDKEGNNAIANGLITHNYFKNFVIDIDVNARNLLALDIPFSSDDYFSGKAYGTGTVLISGPEDNITMDINVSTDDKTRVYFSLLDNNEIEDYNYIIFKKPRSRQEINEPSTVKKSENNNDRQVNFTINLQVDANQNAEVVMITDPSTGDELRARGSGAIRIVMDENMNFELFGRYTIDNGSYKFIYENLLRRDFNIVRGGTIDFNGDPFSAGLDISANYQVNPQLTDLLSLEELNSLNLNKSSIPVNCVLNLTGELQRPDIELGLAFPSADEELRRRIMNVINTEEILNQQLVFLLLFGRFNSNTNNYANSQSGMSSVINTTISTVASQFNKMINDVMGNTNMSVDFDYQNAAYELGAPGEWTVGLSGKWLDNRLTIEGNLGSRENLAQTGSSQFIGEFDANLRMKNSEKWSWKLFNRANDNRYFKSALNTQGFGVVYRENYNTLSELFRQMLESIKRPFQKKEPN